MTAIDAKNKTDSELAMWLEGISSGDRIYHTDFPNFHESAQRLLTGSIRLREQESRIADLERLTTWQPIDTAPATPAGILILTTSGNVKIETGYWLARMVKASKVDGDDCFYTHWMHLPKPPAAMGAKK